MRFVIGRHGRQNLGFLWMFIEPMLLCIGVMVLWRLMKGNFEHGVTVVGMVFSGYMPLTVWRHMTNGSIFIYRASKGLLIHKNVTYLDIIISRLFLELINTTAATIFIYIVLTQTGLMEEAYDITYMITGWLAMAALAFGFGTVVAAASEQNETIAHFIQPFQYLLIPLSGCFTMLDWLPDRYRELLVYVPLVHPFETFRHGLFGPLVTTYGEPFYSVAWGIIFTAIGFMWLDKIRDRIE